MTASPISDVYLDRDQCDYFNVAYMDGGKLVVASDTLLKSKDGFGYPRVTEEALTELGQDTLVLVRKDTDDSGWFKVTNVIPSFARPKEVRDAWKLANGIA